MYNHWEIDLNQSVRALAKIRDKELKQIISGEIFSIENSDNEILIMLDQTSGIDYIRKDNMGLQGIAARVQFGYTYNTFTIRKTRHSGNETEYKKRVKQIENGYFYPAFTMQAYFDNRKDMNLWSIAITRTIDLYSFIEEFPESVRTNWSDNEFMIVSWDEYKEKRKLKKIIKFTANESF